MAWFITVALQPAMGIAWHRFLAFFNIWFKRHADGRTSLGALQPIAVDGEPVDFENIDELDEDAALGVGKVEDFTWKGLLDFNTCTECGRCQSQCPAWNTDKPLSPKLLIMGLRDHTRAKAPYLEALAHPTYLAAQNGKPLQAAEPDARRAGPAHPRRRGASAGRRHRIRATARALDFLRAYNPDGRGSAELGVIDPDVLWSCTTCGACVEQCPVDIEHVDHIVDMRRYQVLIESAFPSELGGLFKNLENAQNPWGMNSAHAAGLGQGPAVRGQAGRSGRRVAGRRRVPLLGRLRRRVRGPRQEDDARRRRAAAHRRRRLRRPG